MLNLNLLPPDVRSRLSYEIRGRAIMAIGGGLVVVLVVFITLLLPTMFYIYFQKADVLRAVAIETAARGGSLSNEVGDIREVNRRAAVVVRNEKDRARLAPFLEDIFRVVPKGILLSSIRVDAAAGGCTLLGSADTRASFLAFLDRLKENPRLANVSSPVAGLVKETDISFSITAQLQ